jgi:hypothetical protein
MKTLENLDHPKLVLNSPFYKHNPIHQVTFFFTNKALNFSLVYEAHWHVPKLLDRLKCESKVKPTKK